MNDPHSRVGDIQRQRALDVIQAGYAEGALTLDEFEERLASAHTPGLTLAEMNSLIEDLPHARAMTSSDIAPATAGQSTHDPARTTDRRRAQMVGAAVAAILAVVIVVFGAGVDSISIFGSRTLMLDGSQDISVLNVFGSTQVVVPDDVVVNANTTAIFGSIECDEACRPSDPTLSVDPVDIGGLNLFGSVEIVRTDQAEDDS